MLKKLSFFLLLTVLSTSCALFMPEGRKIKGAEKYPTVKFEEVVKNAKEQTAIFIDANGFDTYKKGHVPGAIDFSINEVEMQKLLPPDMNRLIICYCGSPKCGAWLKAANYVSSKGYKNVKHYPDGITGYINKKGPLEKVAGF